MCKFVVTYITCDKYLYEFKDHIRSYCRHIRGRAFYCIGLYKPYRSPGATADGSAMITYAADSHTLYGELYSTPAADHAPGEMREVRDWDTGRLLGHIPQPAHTYATVGNINEHGLAISESTWGGREELVDTTGIIDYGSLIYITLERAKTAREAIKTMTDLVAEYGYASEGESFSIADGNEAWIMEMIGKGGKSKGAVWVARRIPDGMISGHANHARIHTFPSTTRRPCIRPMSSTSPAHKATSPARTRISTFRKHMQSPISALCADVMHVYGHSSRNTPTTISIAGSLDQRGQGRADAPCG